MTEMNEVMEISMKVVAAAEVHPDFIAMIERDHSSAVYMRSDEAIMVALNVLRMSEKPLSPELKRIVDRITPMRTPWLMLIRRLSSHNGDA